MENLDAQLSPKADTVTGLLSPIEFVTGTYSDTQVQLSGYTSVVPAYLLVLAVDSPYYLVLAPNSDVGLNLR